jgi:hypothetical protein
MFSDETVENAWMRARAQCECEDCSHFMRHGYRASLIWRHRGQPNREGAWESYLRGDSKIGGWEAVNLCEILCWECYQHRLAAKAVVKNRGEYKPARWSSRSEQALRASAPGEK